MSDRVDKVQKWLDEHEAELIEDTRRMLQIPSLESEALPNAPFGAENRRALDLALNTARAWGFDPVVDLEGYGGWAEIGQGEKMVVTLGHLDVVPVGPGWKHEPFGAEIDGDYIYARGACDDKGPTIASFYAIRAIKECGIELPSRLRIFFGCNEESGFKCVERYAQTEEKPTLGVAPDSGWPLYFAEKGIVNAVCAITLDESREFALLEAYGGSRPNIVIDSMRARVKVAPSIRAEIEEKLAQAWDRNLEFGWDGDILAVVAHGKAAHGAGPFLGDSAGTRLFRLLFEIAPSDDEEFYRQLLESTHPGGVGLGVSGVDEPSGELTSNLGVVTTEGGELRLLFNMRCPVTWPHEGTKARLELQLAKLGWRLHSWTASQPLYFPLDHILTKTILEVYRTETGDLTEPGAMGGGTYARALPDCVSIGTGWKGDGKAHETDERIRTSHLLKMARIYAHLFLRLCDEAAKL